MNISTHVAVGATVGFIARDPYLGFFAAVVSHHVLDMIPHSDPGSTGVTVKNILKHPKALWLIAFDGLLALVFVALFINLYGFNYAIIFGAFGGILPDLVDNSPFWTFKFRKTRFGRSYHKLHEFCHYTVMNPKYIWLGILSQLILIFLALLIAGII